MADVVFAVPALWLARGTAQRMVGLSSVKSLTFGPSDQGVYLQALLQNIRVTLDGASNPVKTGGVNPLGFVLRSTDTPFLFTGVPGTKLLILEETASAELQFQFLTLSGRYS